MTYTNSFESSSTGSIRSTARSRFGLLTVALLITCLGTALAVSAQEKPAPEAKPKPAAKKSFTLRITKEEVIGVSLKADKAKLTDVAADLSKQLGVKVVLGPGMEKEAITVEFHDVTLEPAMRLLAPHVYMDYEIRAGSQPRPLGVMLFGHADPEPAASAIVEASSQALMISGNTEDTGQPNPDEPLQVEFDDENNELTIKARKQPLISVVLTVADVMGIPAEVKYESDEIVDTQIKEVLFEDAIPRLSPNVHLFVRTDLTKSKKTPIRISILPPDTKSEPKLATQ